jgi:hypothetical protein
MRSAAASHVQLKPPSSPDLAPERERFLELGLDLRPRLRAPALVQHHAKQAMDAEPGMPEAGVGVVHFVFGPRGSTVSGRQANVSVSRPLSFAMTAVLLPLSSEPG